MNTTGVGRLQFSGGMNSEYDRGWGFQFNPRGMGEGVGGGEAREENQTEREERSEKNEEKSPIAGQLCSWEQSGLGTILCKIGRNCCTNVIVLKKNIKKILVIKIYMRDE